MYSNTLQHMLGAPSVYLVPWVFRVYLVSWVFTWSPGFRGLVGPLDVYLVLCVYLVPICLLGALGVYFVPQVFTWYPGCLLCPQMFTRFPGWLDVMFPRYPKLPCSRVFTMFVGCLLCVINLDIPHIHVLI